jgi:hypothetical protein
MNARILTLSALALLASQTANATIYFDNTTQPVIGSDGPAADGTTILGASFTAAAPDFSSIKLLLSAGNSADGGSVSVFLVPDNGSGGANGIAGAPTSQTPAGVFTGALHVGTILDSSLTASPSLAALWVNPTITTQDQEYWLELLPTAGASVAWAYDADASGIGTTNQAYLNNFGGGSLIPASDTEGTYEFAVATPEPATIAILGTALGGLGLARRRRQTKA